MKQAATNSSEKHFRDVNWKLKNCCSLIPLFSTERVNIETLFSDCCWNKDNPDQFGWTKMENGLRCVWRVRIMGSGPRKVQQQQKKHSEQPLLFCIKRKILETSRLSFQFPKQTILPLVKYKWGNHQLFSLPKIH